MPFIVITFFLMLLTLAPGAAAGQETRAPRPDGSQWAQVTIEQRVIIRIPTVPMRRSLATPVEDAPAPAQWRWKESRGPKCLPIQRIRGASITPDEGLRMVTGLNEQFRAHFGRSCRAADFYAGFYIQASKDGSLCAGRDTLHARNGSACEIEKFTHLEREAVKDDESDKRREK